MRTGNYLLISAALATLDEDIYSCFAPIAISMAAENKLPESIQLFPPGTHTISASKNGQPHVCTVTISKQTADFMAQDLRDMIAAANAGDGPKPYFDFNHDDKEASGWPTEIYWAGEDKLTGGVRAKLDWSAQGGESVQGKAYRSFSPNFRVSPETGEIIGTVVNMGGLVNRPAFRKIQPLFAKDAKDAGEINQKGHTMNKLHAALVAAGLLSAIPTDEATAVIEFSSRWTPINARLSQGDANANVVTTLKQQNEALVVDRDVYKARAEKMAQTNAETIVAGWVKDGVLAPKDEAGKALWIGILAKDPENAKLMAPVISAKAAAAGAGGGANDPTKTVIINGQSKIEGSDTRSANAFTVKAKEIETSRKLSANEALVIAATENPALYDEYRKSLLFVDQQAAAPGARA